MQEVVLELKKREVTGKAVKRLRGEGLVPAVIHDHGKESVHVEGEYLNMLRAWQRAGKHHPLSVKAGGKDYTVLIKNVDVDPKKHKLRHVVFNAVKADEQVDTEIPVRIKFSEGNESTPAERAGLIVLHQLDAVEVKALPRDLPDVLEFDGEMLVEVGDSATVANLIVPSGVTITTDPAHPLATVFEPSALQAANEAAAGEAEEEKPAEEGEEAEASAEGEKPAENGNGAAKPEEKKE
jgi:large subunit ribosomal protein L25